MNPKTRFTLRRSFAPLVLTLSIATSAILSGCQAKETFPSEIQETGTSQAMAQLPAYADAYVGLDIAQTIAATDKSALQSNPQARAFLQLIETLEKSMGAKAASVYGQVAIAAWLPGFRPGAPLSQVRWVAAWKTSVQLDAAIAVVTAAAASNASALQGASMTANETELKGRKVYEIITTLPSQEASFTPETETFYAAQGDGAILIAASSGMLTDALDVGGAVLPVTEDTSFTGVLSGIDQSAPVWFVITSAENLLGRNFMTAGGYGDFSDGIKGQVVAKMTSAADSEAVVSWWDNMRDQLSSALSMSMPWATEGLNGIEILSDGDELVIQVEWSQRFLERLAEQAAAAGAGAAPGGGFGMGF